MKSVIVEIKDGFAAVLSDNGCIEKIKDNNYSIGQVIVLKRGKVKKLKKLAIMASTAATFVMLCGAGVWASTSPYSYVSLDVNPSIEFTLNRFDRVLSVEAVNPDGEEILKKVSLDEIKYEKVDKALTEAINAIYEEGYFKDDVEGDVEGGLVIATYGQEEEGSEELAEEIKENIILPTEETDETNETPIDGNIENDEYAENEENAEGISIEVTSVGLQRVQEARELGVTPGKLNLVQKLQASAENPEDFNMEEWLDKPVKEIMKATKENKKALKASAKSDVEEENIEEATDITTDDTITETSTSEEQTADNERMDKKDDKNDKNDNKDNKDKVEKINNANKKNDNANQKSNNNAAKGNGNKNKK